MRLSSDRWLQESEPESKAEAAGQPEGELRIEAEQMTGVEDAAASPTAAAKFEEPPSESEVMLPAFWGVFCRKALCRLMTCMRRRGPQGAVSVPHVQWRGAVL